MKRVGAALAAILATVVLFSCGDDDKPTAAAPVGVFTGKLTGSEAHIGVTVGKANITAWVCNGADGLALQFSTPRLGDGFDVTLPSGFRMAGTVTGKQLRGALGGPTGATQFTLALAGPDAGVWTLSETVDGEQQASVWVVLNDGAVQGANIGDGSVRAPGRLNKAKAARTNPGGGGGGLQQAQLGQNGQLGQGFGGGFNGGQLGQGGFNGQGFQGQFGGGQGPQGNQFGGQLGQLGQGGGGVGGKGFGFGG
jgi:hypothetical protein